MTKKKIFATIFPICENVHLTKDVGHIPYFLHKLYGYDAKIVTYKNNERYPGLDEEVKGLKLDFINNTGRLIFLEKAVLQYIWKNAKNIDVLNLYFFSKQSFVYGIMYKILNPKGFLYLKLDAYNETFAEGGIVAHSQKRIKNIFLKQLEKWFLQKADLLSIETREGERLLKLMYPRNGNKIIYLPVGVNDLFLNEHFSMPRGFEQKENIILTVGRIGAGIKNHEMILRALTKVNMKDWKMYFIGKCQPEFLDFFDQACRQFPDLKTNVVFTGEILDRIRLYEWYDRSKIFCLTSYRESFGISMIEAFYFGNYIVGTDGVMSLKDVTANGSYGAILKYNDDALAQTLQNLIDNDGQLSSKYNEIIKFAHENFVWSKIIRKLHERIENGI